MRADTTSTEPTNLLLNSWVANESYGKIISFTVDRANSSRIFVLTEEDVLQCDMLPMPARCVELHLLQDDEFNGTRLYLTYVRVNTKCRSLESFK